MKPEQALRLMNAYVDRELDLATALEFEAELASHPALKAGCREIEQLGSAVRSHAPYYTAPQSLRSRVATGATRGFGAARLPGWLPAAAAFAAGVLVTVAAYLFAPSASEEDRLANEMVASHVRATLGNRLVDVASSDQHTVKPWLSARLDYSPPVRDFAADGFELAGGRLDYINGRPVADLVYRHRLHTVDVFIWPASPDQPLRTTTSQGYNLVHFTRGGMSYWLVSDVALADLEQFAQALPRSSSQ
jgi:anti-sigma factor RsiW